MKVLAFALLLGLLVPNASSAAKVSTALGVGTTFYTGEEADSLTPPLSGAVSFSVISGGRSLFALAHRFAFEVLISGENFAGQYGQYLGLGGTYAFLGRLRLGKGGIVPYLELGPILGMYVARLSSPPTGTSTNQSSFKYGYDVGIGFDWTKDDKGGGGGWGLGVSYFNFLPSISSFEFPAAAQSAKGIMLELRYIFGNSK